MIRKHQIDRQGRFAFWLCLAVALLGSVVGVFRHCLRSLFLLGAVGLSACMAQTLPQSRAIEISPITDEAIVRGISALAEISRTKTFRTVDEIEALIDAKGVLVINQATYLEYELTPSGRSWFKTARVTVEKQPNKSWIRSLQINSGLTCMPEHELSTAWFRSAGIPFEKSLSNRDFANGWVRNLNIPHLTHAIAWEYRMPDGRSVGYWARRDGADICAGGISFSFL